MLSDKERIVELELQHSIDEQIISILKEITNKQRDTIKKLRERINELTPNIIA